MFSTLPWLSFDVSDYPVRPFVANVKQISRLVTRPSIFVALDLPLHQRAALCSCGIVALPSPKGHRFQTERKSIYRVDMWKND